MFSGKGYRPWNRLLQSELKYSDYDDNEINQFVPLNPLINAFEKNDAVQRPPPGFDFSYSSISSATVTPSESPQPTLNNQDSEKEKVNQIDISHQTVISKITPFSFGLRDWKGLPMIVKMTNISWEITKSDVQQFVKGIDVGNIHIPIDRHTGKTKNQIFIEIYSGHLELVLEPKDLETKPIPASLELRNGDLVKGRSIMIVRSSWSEMMTSHFPNASPISGSYLTREEINSILNICRNYKARVFFISTIL